MRLRRAAYLATHAYVGGLFLGSTATALWVFLPEVQPSARVAGLWFALAGFGALVFVTLVMVHYSW